jgi:hypothetical protein
MAQRLGVSPSLLRRDRELYDFSHANPKLTVKQIREWCEDGSLAQRFPALPELFSAMTDAEIKEWCEGGELVEEYLGENADLPDSYWGLPEEEVQELREHGKYHRGSIPSPGLPPDPGLKLRQLRALLADEIEFRTRYPEAYRLLFASSHPDERKDIGGLYLPTFGCRIAFSAPHSGALEDRGGKLTDAYSATPDTLESGRPVVQTLLPLDPGHLRGLILAILGREEYAELIDPPGGRERELLLTGVGAPAKEPVRLTDLRLAVHLGKLNPGCDTGAAREREHEFRAAHRRWRRSRNIEPPDAGFPGIRYVLLHSLAHAIIRQLAIGSGYTTTSIRERIYSRDAGYEAEPMAGVLLYTAAPDSEGTLGGLVSLGDPELLGTHLEAALAQVALCASDPLCAENVPQGTALHGAACHACLFAPETSCERGNKYLDRSVLVDTFGLGANAFFGQDSFRR